MVRPVKPLPLKRSFKQLVASLADAKGDVHIALVKGSKGWICSAHNGYVPVRITEADTPEEAFEATMKKFLRSTTNGL